MPGDSVRAKVIKKRGGIHSALLEEVVTQAANRQTPLCKHFARCGGCRWQHVPYAEQLELKEALVRKSFAALIDDSVLWKPLVRSPQEWQYRNKMEFSFSQNARKELFLGLMLGASRGKVENLTECHLVHPWFMEAVEAARQWWKEAGVEAYHPSRNAGSLRTLIVREGFRTGDRMVMLTVSGNPDYALNKAQIAAFTAHVRRAVEPKSGEGSLSVFLRIQQIAKGVPTNFYEMHLYGTEHVREVMHVGSERLQFHVSPSAFFQPNPLQAEQLYAAAVELAEVPADATVYDLYCGTGTLGICVAKSAKQVIGIEASPEAVIDARENATLNGVHNIRFFQGTVEDLLAKVHEENSVPRPDVVFVDPPRAGLDPQALLQLVDLQSPKIVYVSCNPVTQAANIAELIKGGYRLTIVQPFDQFPQTVHIENIAVLERACQS